MALTALCLALVLTAPPAASAQEATPAIAPPSGPGPAAWSFGDHRLAGAVTQEHLRGSPQEEIQVFLTRLALTGDAREGLEAIARADWEPFQREHPLRLTYGLGYHRTHGLHLLLDLTEAPEGPLYQLSTGLPF